MSEKAKIYTRLAKLIEECSQEVKICIPSRDYYRKADDWRESTITVVDTAQLVQALMLEANKEE